MANQSTKVSGTFAATGVSNDIAVSNQGRIKLAFAGTATVQLEEYSETSGGFIATGDVFTATGVYSVVGGGQRTRLNCTAYTDDVVYEILPG